MPTPSIVFFLCMFTLTAFIGAALWQRRRVSKAKQRGERSELGKVAASKSS
ncbi:MAG: hypothetical protein ACE37N_10225 [Pseudohongiellaceae bacterium]|jgi:hypothetical protein